MRIIFLFSAIVCATLTSFGQPFWQRVHSPTTLVYTTNIYSLYADAGRAVYVNSSTDGLFRSTDGGTSWAKRSSTLGFVLGRSGAYLFAGVISAGTSSGLLRSSDDGATWQYANSGYDGGLGGKNVFVAAFAANGNIMASATPRNCNCTTMYLSTDTGTTWSPVDTAGFGSSTVLCMAHSGQRWIAGTSGGLFSSVDDGVHWGRTGPTPLDSIQTNWLFAGGDTIIASVNNATLFRSADRGATWTAMGTQAIGGGNVCVAGGHVILNTSLTLFFSSDDGARWDSARCQPAFHGYVRQFGIVDDQHIIALTDQGLYRTSDAGRSWTLFTQSVTTDTVAVGPTFMTLDGAGDVVCVANQNVYRTSDHGSTYTPIYVADQYDKGVTAIAFDDAHGRIYLTAGRGAVLRSTDNGASWLWIYPGPSGLAQGPVFVDRQGTVFVSGTQQGGMASADGGGTWQQFSAGLPQGAINCFLQEPGGALLAGTSLGVFQSSDGGVTWTGTSDGLGFITSYVTVYALQPLGAQDMAAAASDGVYVSADGGRHWQRVFHATTWGADEIFTSLATHGSRVIAAGTTDHGVFLTTDAGATWQQIENGLQDSAITSLVFDQSGYLYAGAPHNTYRSVLPLITAISGDVAPERASLALRVFPNPSATVATLDYALPTDAAVAITIVNALGETIAAPVSASRQSAGAHRSSVDLRALPAGAYWCTLQTGNQRMSRQLFVVK